MVLLLTTVAFVAPASAGGPWKFPHQPRLAGLTDATGLSGAGLVRAPSTDLPGGAATAQLTVPTTRGDRSYLLAPARRVAPRSRPRLLLVLPAANTLLRTGYDRYSLDALRDHGFTIAVVGTYGGSWNAGSCCGRPHAAGVDDVAAVTAVRDDALRRSGADPARVAVMGHSVGAMMAWRLACTPGFHAYAVVAVSGTLVSGCPALPATPRMLSLNGALDATVPFDGSPTVLTVLGIAPPPVPGSVATLRSAGRCSTARRFASANSTVQQYDGCTGGGLVRLQVVAGTGHGWLPLDATRRASAFLGAVTPGVR